MVRQPLLGVADTRGASPFVSCLEQAEDGDGWIVRLWNDGEERAVSTNGAMAGVDTRRVMLDESAANAPEAGRDGFLMRESELLTPRLGHANDCVRCAGERAWPLASNKSCLRADWRSVAATVPAE